MEMKIITVFICIGFFGYSNCLPPVQDSSKEATILQQDYNKHGNGNYKFQYQTSDGMSREENAELKNEGTDNEALVVQGSYSYVGSDGVTYTINYVADENGYRPTGEHIPQHNTIAQ
ncbi:endocuticle structural glycoprotein SgAbd-5-like [Onthophagus taurus]|uniref:endocuticle structural glycoprotein SgAbd-5-like n=1 Tax=Onthophagus taurus TaxID=166361 RepID=UPI0039BDABE9